MTKKCYHLGQANHNQKLAESIQENQNNYKDWVITIAFYAAIHYIEAKMANMDYLKGTEEKIEDLKIEKGIKNLSHHKAREILIKDYHPFRKIKREFKKLRFRSEQARYLKGINKTSYDFFAIEDSKNSLKDLEKIKNTLVV